MRHLPHRAALLLAPILLLTGLNAGSAYAAVSATLNPAVVEGTDFSWTCDINPGGTTIYVVGRSWYDPSRPGFPAVDTVRQSISGTVTRRLTFRRDGEPLTSYGYRCVWYSFKEENTSTTDDEPMADHQLLRPSLAASRSVGKPYGHRRDRL